MDLGLEKKTICLPDNGKIQFFGKSVLAAAKIRFL